MKTVKIKSAIPIYLSALTWILFGLFSPIYEWKFLLLTTCCSIVVYWVSSVFLPGRTIEAAEKVETGDREIDRQIEEGMNTLIRLKSANDAIAEETVSQNLDRMVAAGEKIFAALREDLSRASQVRKFMNYYLPTTDKLIAQYRNLRSSGSRGENVIGAMRSIEKSLGMIADAFEKQLDSLYKHEALDIQTDIDVLEAMLSADGFHASQGGESHV